MRTRGDARIRLKRTNDRVVAVLVYTNRAGGCTHALELTTDDVENIFQDLEVAFDPDKQTVDGWYRQLAASDTRAK
jgi:hypothetical protein